MRQRLIKAIFCIALSVSVFFCHLEFSFATEIDPADYIGFEVDASQTRSVPLMGAFVDDTVFYGETYLNNNFTIILQPGYVYSGQVDCRFTITFSPDANTTKYLINVADTIVRSSSVDVGVAFDVYRKDGDNFICDLLITFNGVYAQTELPITISYTSLCYCSGVNTSGLTDRVGQFSVSGADDFASRNWIATLPEDYNVGGVVNDVGQAQMQQQSQISQQEMQQQQQIADQQAQQSAQQHDNLVNGYDNAANDNMLADKNSVLQGFEQQQDQAISGGQQYVSDYSAGFSTAPLQAMAPAFMMISTWFNDLWSGMGNFSTVLVVGLMLCVAGYILKLKH